MKAVGRTISWMTEGASGIAGILVVLMVTHVFLDVLMRFIFQKHSKVVLVGELGVDLVGDGQELDVCASKRFAHVTDLELIAVFRVVSDFIKQPFEIL